MIVSPINNSYTKLNDSFTDKQCIIEGYTKLNDSFTDKQCIIEGYTKPYRLDRNCNGGGILIYVRKDISSKELNKNNFTKNIEALFIEINLRKNKFLLVGTYHSTHPEYGTSDLDFFEQIGF